MVWEDRLEVCYVGCIQVSGWLREFGSVASE